MDANPAHIVAAPSSAASRRDLGARGERLAAARLEAAGLEIVERNWRVADGDLRGEIDLVALDHGARHVVIVEVKTRSGAGFGGPLAALTPRKQHQLRRLALRFALDMALPYRQLRFDVVAITVLPGRPPEVVHLKAAF